MCEPIRITIIYCFVDEYENVIYKATVKHNVPFCETDVKNAKFEVQAANRCRRNAIRKRREKKDKKKALFKHERIDIPFDNTKRPQLRIVMKL